MNPTIFARLFPASFVAQCSAQLSSPFFSPLYARFSALFVTMFAALFAAMPSATAPVVAYGTDETPAAPAAVNDLEECRNAVKAKQWARGDRASRQGAGARSPHIATPYQRLASSRV